jgi:hypothetical protein
VSTPRIKIGWCSTCQMSAMAYEFDTRVEQFRCPLD